jgi:citrate synthase
MSDGLEGVVAAETVLSEVDGAAGVLIIRGRSLDELAGHARYEDVVALLFEGFYPDLPADIPAALGKARVEVFAEVSALDTGLLDRTPVEAMRALTARLADGDDIDVAFRLLAAPAVFTAAVVRAQACEADALDTYLVTVADHGLNASTFAARVVASTRAGLGSAVLAGISALKGPLHGGAPGPIIEMLDEIGGPANARTWIENALARGDRLMGFGHRIYKVRDPRADALKTAVRWLDARQGRLEFAEAVEAAALAILREHKPERSLQTNVEFYTALLLEALDFPPSAFTCVFAMGRVAGWLAHAREQLAGGRLIRPASVYIGPMPKKAA